MVEVSTYVLFRQVQQRSKGGFTLVEVLLAVSLVAMMAPWSSGPSMSDECD